MDWFGLEETSAEERVKSVSEVSSMIREMLDDDSLHGIWVEGEITNFRRHSSGHLYFSLTESVSGRDYLINCAMWRSSAREVQFEPGNGMQVDAYGSVEVYEPYGKYQFIVREMRPAGEGDRYLLIAKWKKELAAAGLFDASLKKALPEFPAKVGVVTSPTGAARRDIENVIARRYPVEIILSPASVQGDNAPFEIAAAIRRIDGLADVIIVGRGGGSFEDLFPFNHPEVVRAISGCRTPVISAVGHEIDYTLSDLAADVRAPTPSAAAELVVPDRTELLAGLKAMERELAGVVLNRIERESENIEALRMHLSPRRFEQSLNEQFERLGELYDRLCRSVRGYIEMERMSLGMLKASLGASDPAKPLERGYSIVKKEGLAVGSVARLCRGDEVVIVMNDGEFTAVIEGVKNGKKL